MQLCTLLWRAVLAAGYVIQLAQAGNLSRGFGCKIAPKVFIISMFAPEADIWYARTPLSGVGDLFAHNISAPGLSMLYPHVHCVEDGSVCQLTTSMSEINAASSVMALGLSNKFDLTRTYFLLAGIAGINPKHGTMGSVALARYSVQVALQYEFDTREMPKNFTTGYLPYGVKMPGEYPQIIYGTEVFEVNEALRDVAFNLAAGAELSDRADVASYRARYGSVPEFKAATLPPSVLKCDTTTSDVYFTGALLGDTFENTTKLLTNGSGLYCMTAQEDNATLEVMVRLAIEGLIDFARVIVMRTGSNFDRPPPGVTPYHHLVFEDQNGFLVSIDNIFNAGIAIVKGIVREWDSTFARGISPKNYIGDIFGSLGGEPDFGPGSLTGGQPVKPCGKSGNLHENDEELVDTPP